MRFKRADVETVLAAAEGQAGRLVRKALQAEGYAERCEARDRGDKHDRALRRAVALREGAADVRAAIARIRSELP